MKRKLYVSPELSLLCCESSCSLMFVVSELSSSSEDFVDSGDVIMW